MDRNSYLFTYKSLEVKIPSTISKNGNTKDKTHKTKRHDNLQQKSIVNIHRESISGWNGKGKYDDIKIHQCKTSGLKRIQGRK